jgi:hypothetical protein
MKIYRLLPFFFSLFLALPMTVSAQSLTAESTKSVDIPQGQDPRIAKKNLQKLLDLSVVRNLLETSFAIKITPQVEAKLPELVEILSSSITYAYQPSDGLDMKGRAKITIASAKLKEILTNKEIGAGDIAAGRAKILVSIDEYIGVATTNDGKTATASKVSYSHDKSTFSDTSAKASGSEAASASNASKNDVNYSANSSVAVAGKQSSATSASQNTAVAGRQDTAVAGRKDTAVAYQGAGGSAAGAQSTQFAGAQSTQYAGSQSTKVASAQSSQFAGSASSQKAYSDKSTESSASSSSSSFNKEQNNVQQRNDKVSLTVETKMPEFNNAKPMSGGVLAAQLGKEFLDAGLELVAEEGLRSEGGVILTWDEIRRKDRVQYFKDLIKKKNLNADVWATGSANYTIVGTNASGTFCNGTLFVQGRFIDTGSIIFEGSLPADAVGNGDQDCQAKLGIGLASSLAKTLSERANKALQAKNSRGSVIKVYLYSASSLSRPDRKAFTEILATIPGVKLGDPDSKDYYMQIDAQYAGPRKLADEIDDIIDTIQKKLGWPKADILTSTSTGKICVGIEGKGACPVEFRN